MFEWYQIVGLAIAVPATGGIVNTMRKGEGNYFAVSLLWLGASAILAGTMIDFIREVGSGESKLFWQIFSGMMLAYLVAAPFWLSFLLADATDAFSQTVFPAESLSGIFSGLLCAPLAALAAAPLALMFSLFEGASASWLPMIGHWSPLLIVPALFVAVFLALPTIMFLFWWLDPEADCLADID